MANGRLLDVDCLAEAVGRLVAVKKIFLRCFIKKPDQCNVKSKFAELAVRRKKSAY